MQIASAEMLFKGFCLFKTLLLITLCLSFLEIATAQSKKLHPEEVATLRVIGEKLKNRKWDFSVDPCEAARNNSWGWAEPTQQWEVVQSKTYIINNLTCDCNITNSTFCHVTSIMLKGQNLTGVLPEKFADLTHLQYLVLSRNYLNGTIPKLWAKLPLVELILKANRISGTIPDELGSITTLESLVLEANQLHGQIPPALGNLKNLNQLLLSSNNFTGELPDMLGNLRNLTEFRIDDTSISGRIPSFIGNWIQLQYLFLQGTSLEGPLPPTIVDLTNITELWVSDWIRGDGKFPPLQQMTTMTRLTLRNLSISGPIPDFLSNMQQLISLDLSFNNFTGQIPATFNRPNLQYIFLTNNALNGRIPRWVTGQYFDLSYNTFTDISTAPDKCQDGYANYVASYSSSDSNSISCCLRKNFPCSEKAKNFNLFINCGGKSVMLDENEYEGDESPQGPSAFEVSDSKKWAYTSTGSFISNKRAPYLATNATILNMTNSDLYTTARLSPNTLRYYGLCLQNGTYTVKLHFAEITFTNDQTYSSLGQRYFDVSIQGQKVLQDFNIARAANGTGRVFIKEVNANVTSNTLEIHFEWTGKGTQSLPQLNSYGPLISAISVTPNFKPATDDNKLATGAILGIIAAIAALLILGFMGICIRRKNLENLELKSLKLPTGRFSLKQIKAATGNFDQANKIGEGGFGSVYKGVLPDGSIIAAKQLSTRSKQGNREFINEMGMISALQHPNLVKLYGCCVEGSQLLLIYEYMENNCLARALFGEESRLKLDWQTRRKICAGIARGLTYLHEESSIKIVHRDIKATNILLDKDMNAKISDFGLAKLDEEEHTHISTRIAGTVGYMAPEYAMRGYLTDKADVYSFGVVMLEIVSGMSNTSYRPREESVYLLDWAYVLQEQGNLLELVDTTLGSKYSEEEALQMLRLSLICTNISPTLRPKMSSVVSMLEGNSPVQVPSLAETPSEFQEMRFKALQRVSHDSQAQSISAEGLSCASSSSLSSQNHSSKKNLKAELETSKLLSEITN